MTTFTGSRILDAERHTEAMATAAEFALIHLLHQPALVGSPRWNGGVMAIITVIAFICVRLMTEIDVSGTWG